ncbi:MAG: phosphoenolpyruvate--protein phosphotransferase [Malacoplasma sp.]
MSKTLKGIGSSSGISFAKAFLLKNPIFNISNTKITNIDEEIKKVKKAFLISSEQLENIKKLTIDKIGEDKAIIFDAHIQIINDPEALKEIEIKINKLYNGAFAIEETFQNIFNIFNSMQDPYFKERASDVLDVKQRILANYLDVKLPDLLSINTEVIIVSTDLTPSQTALLDKKYVKGFLTDVGGRTSHAAIMARTMEIPAVLGLKNITSLIQDGEMVALNGSNGIVEILPENINDWKRQQDIFELDKKELKKYVDKQAITLDGHHVEVEANIGKPKDADNLINYGGNGVGLYRSEFLYMDSNDWPSEDEQFEAYKYVLESQKDKMVVVRTLDIGGDKNLNYYKFAHEDNPFLGYRAIRLCLDKKDIFKTQLRALIRASAFGKLGIMFPMISTIDEIIEAKKILKSCYGEFENQGVKTNDIKIGMMVEVPSTVFLADKFAEHVDFFSIGTNDLIQYTFAVDRMSEVISHLYQPNNPSLLRAIKMVIEGASKHNVKVAMCGEMAGDILSIPILIGLANKGLDALSMSASSILKAKKIISSMSHAECKELANVAINMSTANEVNDLVSSFLEKKNLI